MKLSVALPLYNAKNIAWLAMESLCRQKDIDFEWELVIMEEQNGKEFGYKEAIKYSDRLKEVNCSSFKYISLEEWVPLGDKWQMIAEECQGEIFMLQAGDCYSQPYRIKETYELMKDCDWLQSKYGIFYDLKLKKEILFNHTLYNHPCGLNMATLTKYAVKLPRDGVKICVDSWFKAQVTRMNPQHISKWNTSDNWMLGFDSNGQNNLSQRAKYFNNPTAPFTETRLRIKDFIPYDIFNRL